VPRKEDEKNLVKTLRVIEDFSKVLPKQLAPSQMNFLSKVELSPGFLITKKIKSRWPFF